VRRACIDIGSNTTRLLVADCAGKSLVDVHQERVFTHVGRGRYSDGSISEEKLEEVAIVVAEQVDLARQLGAVEVRAVATAAIRDARNGSSLTARVRTRCGIDVEILSWQEEARLAFIGVAHTLESNPAGELGVVDVGGGSSELVVGMPPDRVSWAASLPLGSAELTHSCLPSDPPDGRELDLARAEVETVLAALDVPRPVQASAVGGSAASLATLAGTPLDEDAFSRSLEVLSTRCAADVARDHGLEEERVRLLPAGLMILQAASRRFGVPLNVGRGGLREAILLEGSSG
jgi:exopolyphosphatase / guanosine-5'-triphosphate,3'-diphosphate pyrophosphatase